MTRPEAVKIAKKLHSEGQKYDEIAHALLKAGYRSRRTGGLLSPGGVQRLIIPFDSVKFKRQKKSKTRTGILNIIPTILGLDLDDETKLKAIKGLLA